MKLVFATHNQNKFREVKALMPSHIELLSLKDIGCDEEIQETASTIEGNARLKADYVVANYGYNCFADDTGLEVQVLNNEPGIFSARYAGPDNDAERNMRKLLDNLEGENNRSARFKTAIALRIEGVDKLFLGICEGDIIKSQRGDAGFGYDPIFRPKGANITFAEMTLEEKNEIGHRAQAIKLLVSYLSE
jgi:XTP/dITP diphosphohydrolase